MSDVPFDRITDDEAREVVRVLGKIEACQLDGLDDKDHACVTRVREILSVLVDNGLLQKFQGHHG